MTFSDDDIDSFIEAYRDDIGETLSREEAADAARTLFDLIDLLVAGPAGGTPFQAPGNP